MLNLFFFNIGLVVGKERAEKPEINLSSLSVSCCDGEITDDKLLAGASWTRRFHSDHSSLL